MILNHLWAKYSHNSNDWQHLHTNHENLIYSASHILLIGFIPAICSYFSAVYLGWTLGNGTSVQLLNFNALILSTFTYILMVGGVFILSLIAWRLAIHYQAYPSFSHTLELCAYTATPIFTLGFCALYPKSWFIAASGLCAVAYSTYLLHSGINIVIHMEAHQKKRYTLALIGCAAIVFVGIFALTLWLYSP